MADIPPPVDTHEPRGPNFPLVVAAATVVMLVLFVAAYILLHHDARKFMLQPQTHPTSFLHHVHPIPCIIFSAD